MSQGKRHFNLGLIIGILGVIAGIILLLSGDKWIIGASGSIASAGLGYHGYRELKS